MAKGNVKVTETKVKVPRAKSDHAVATSKAAFITDTEKIDAGRKHSAAMKASPEWANAPAVQTAAAGWDDATNNLEGNEKAMGTLRDQLAGLQAKVPALRADCNAGRKHTIGAVNAHCKGSAPLIQSLGFDVLTHAPRGAAIAVPGTVVASAGANPGEVDISWDDSLNRHGYMVQCALNPADPTTYLPPVPCTSGSYVLKHQVPASNVHCRVAAIDPDLEGHLTEWSPWASGTAR